MRILTTTKSTEQLHDDLIEELQLKPDVLNNNMAVLKINLSQLRVHLGKKEQAAIAKIYQLLPAMVQPALLLRDGQNLIEQQALSAAAVPVAGGNLSATENPDNDDSSSPQAARATIANESPVQERRTILSSSSQRSSLNSSSSSRLTITRANNSSSLSRQQLKAECYLEEMIKALKIIIPNLLGKSMVNLLQPIKGIIEFYEAALKEWQIANGEKRKNLLLPYVQVEFKSEKDRYYIMSQELARKALCRDEYGLVQKSNSSGNHAVSISAKLVKKGSLEEGELDPISPAMEKIVVSFSNLLGEQLLDDSLVAPTTLIKLNQIVFQQVSQELSDPQEWQQFNEKCQERKLPTDVLVKKYSKLNITQHELGAFIQVGKTVHGWSLLDLLLLIQQFEEIEQFFGQAEFVTALPMLIKGEYVDLFLQNNPHYQNWLADLDIEDQQYQEQVEALFSGFFTTMILLVSSREPNKRLKEFIKADFSNSDQGNQAGLYQEFKGHHHKLPVTQRLALVALLSMWPELMVKRDMFDLIQITKLFKKIPELFPDRSIPEIIVELPQLLNLIDPNNYTAHLINSLLLNPSDGKADNYMVELERNTNQQIVNIKIKGIDSDQALAHPLIRGKILLTKEEVHYAGVKCILYCLPSINKNASQSVLQRFLKINPELLILSWLVDHYYDDCAYQRFVKNSKAELDIPIQLDPNNIPLIYKKMKQLQQIVAQNMQITNQQLFSLMEPLLNGFYSSIYAQEKYPVPAMNHIYYGNYSAVPTFEEVLAPILDTNFVMQEAKQVSYRELLKTYVGDDRYYKLRIQPVEKAILDFLNILNLRSFLQNQEVLWPMLRLIANFDFLKSLPLDPLQLKQLFYLAIINGETAVIKLFLNCNTIDVNAICDDEDHTPLRLAVVQPTPSIETVKVLLQHKKINPNAFDKNGDTALTLADPNNDELISTLINYGVNIELAQARTGKTILDKAIEEDKPDIFVKLINKGAGATTDPTKMWDYICKYRHNSVWQESMRNAINVLAAQNSEFAWLVTVETITQVDNPTQSLYAVVMVTNQGIQRRYIKQEVMPQMFDMQNDKVIGIKKSNQYGRRAVAFIDHDGQKMHVKSYPEIFATEEAVKLLWRMIFPQGGITESGVFRFFDAAGNPYPVLISRHVEGENLQQVVENLSKAREFSNLLDERRFSEVLAMTLLINPEDDKPDNKILRYFINHEGVSKLEIVGIDNDHAFVFPILRDKDHRVLQVKTIVACLDQMRDSIHPDVVDVILKLSPDQLLLNWLNAVNKRQTLYDVLFTEEQRRAFFNSKDNPILTRIPLPQGIVSHMYNVLLRMQKILKRNPNISHIDFISRVEPSFVVYKYMLESEANPGARFRTLFKEQYSTVIANRFDTVVTGKHILQSAKIPDKDMISNTVDYGPEQAIIELNATIQEGKNLKDVAEQLFVGNVNAFKKLLLTDSRELVLKDLVFKDLAPEVRVVILKALHTVPLESLDLHGCADVQSNLIKPIFENSPNMKAIDISGCQKLDVELLDAIAKYCPALEKLCLSDLPWTSLSFKGKVFYFQGLKRLWLNNCVNLKEVSLRAPRLKWLSAKNLPQLTKFDLQGGMLNSLSLEGTDKIPAYVIERLLSQSPDLLKSLNIKGTFSISARMLTWLNAAFGGQQWQASNINAMIKARQLILQGLPITDKDLENISYFGRRITNVNLVGAAMVSWEGILILLSRMFELQSIQMIDYGNLQIKSEAATVNGIVEALAVGYADQFYAAGRDSLLRKCYLLSLDDTPEVMEGHNKPISCVYTVSGLIFTGAYDGVVRVWDANTNNCLKEIKAHASTVKSIKYLPYKNVFISASEDRTIKFWDVYTGLMVKVINTRFKINALEIFDERLMAGHDNGSISIFEINTGEPLNSIAAHQNPILAMKKVSCDWLVTTSGDYTAKVWDVNNSKCVTTLTGHTALVTAVEVLLGNSLVATGSADKTIKIWDVSTGKCLVTWADHDRRITALALVENKLLSTSEDGALKIWKFPIKEIALDIIRNTKPFQITRQDALIRVQSTRSDKVVVFKFIGDFVTQLLGVSEGLRIDIDINKGEMSFSINNPNKYIAVDNILSAINQFITRSNLVHESKPRASVSASSAAKLLTATSTLKPVFWKSAKPNKEETPKTLFLQSRLPSANFSI